MSEEWKASQNFERTHELISAINLLSIHAKMMLMEGVVVFSPPKIEKARKSLLSFLDQLDQVVTNAEMNSVILTLGVDAQLNLLGKEFIVFRKQTFNPALKELSIAKLKQLVQSEDPQQYQQLIDSLTGLRELIELNSQSDKSGVLGGM